jgi:predicted ATPase
MFELGARPHPPRQVYRSYLAQSQVFVGIYWQSYGWMAPGEQVSGLEDEYLIAAGLPRLIYVKSPAPGREPRLAEFLTRIQDDDAVSYQRFSDAAELQRLVEDDLAVLLSERFELTRPAVAATAQAATLPVLATPLVDREREAAEAEDLVVRQGARLITLTGPGGVGKSRLVIEVAGRLSERFPDGVRFVDLSSVPSADLVPAAVAARLGLKTSGDRLIADLVSYLRAKRLLLVLDNVEQLTDGAPLLARLLAAAPGVTALVTSRTVLRISGEYELSVPPLQVPPRGAGNLLDYASVQLFVARAHAVAPGFTLTEENAQAVAEICRRLDGLPLAIVLAAARIRLLPPRALLARLDDRMSVLTSGPRDLPERQRTLKNTLDWSFDLLSATEQALFARLGVFAGTFGLPAATAVAGDAAQMDTLSSLVDSSLIRPEPRDGTPRFSMLETIREYALDRLCETGDWGDAHDKHAAYFLALAHPAESELHGPGQLAWLDPLELRHDNLNAALFWLTDRNPGQALDLMWATWRFWWLHGHAEELTRHADMILARTDALPPRERALALSGAGFAYLAGGDQTRARQLLKRSLPQYRQAGDRLGMGLAAAGLGHLLAAQRRTTLAADLLEQTLGRLRGMATDQLTGPPRVLYLLDVALASNFLCQIRLDQGDHRHAAELFADGLSAAHSAADRFTILVSLYDLALSHQAGGDLTDAADLLKQGLALAAEAGDGPSLAYYLEAMAHVAARQDRPDRAVSLLSAAAALLEARGSGWLHAYVPRAPHGDSTLAALRAQMTGAAFEHASAYGRSLSSPGAVRHALEEQQAEPAPDAPAGSGWPAPAASPGNIRPCQSVI